MKLNRSGNREMRAGFLPGGRLTAMNVTLRHLLQLAYSAELGVLPGAQIAGGPSWLDSDRFDVDATAAEGQPTDAQMRAMTKALLADRFRIVTRVEKREQPAYFLVADGDRSASRLRSSTGADCRSSGTGGPGDDGLLRCGHTFQENRWIGRNLTMEQVARQMTTVLGGERLVLDRTGLEGAFSFDLEYNRTATLSPQPDAASELPSIFTALPEQLGLRLDSTKAIVDVLVVDRAERPTEN